VTECDDGRDNVGGGKNRHYNSGRASFLHLCSGPFPASRRSFNQLEVDCIRLRQPGPSPRTRALGALPFLRPPPPPDRKTNVIMSPDS